MLITKINNLAQDSFNNNKKNGLKLSIINRKKLIREIRDEINFPNALRNMPQLCFGTPGNKINEALEAGYRHFDGAELYGIPQSDMPLSEKKREHDEYRNIIKTSLKKYSRNELWITWKDDNITVEKIRRIIQDLDCNYIDLFLIHNSCGTENDFIEFKKAENEKLIRFYGISNCENFEQIQELANKYDIFANQIQARPPEGIVEGKTKFNPTNFIEECNKLNVNIMLFSPIEGISSRTHYFFYNLDKKEKELGRKTSLEESGDFIRKSNIDNNSTKGLSDFDVYIIFANIFFSLKDDMIKYYILKYILNTNNVIMVGSYSPDNTNLRKNITDFNDYIQGGVKLTDQKISEIELEVPKLILYPKNFPIEEAKKFYDEKSRW